MKSLVIVIILVNALAKTSSLQKEEISLNQRSCHSENVDVSPYLSTRTPYRVIHEQNKAKIIRHHLPDQCVARQIWMLVRHGTRNPSASVIKNSLKSLSLLREKIVVAHQNGKGLLCATEVNRLQNWAMNITEIDEKLLVPEGERELKNLGSRTLTKYFGLLNYDSDDLENSEINLKFRYTDTERTYNSAQHFAIGLLDSNDTSQVQFTKSPLKHDPLLRFYQSCLKWKTEVKDNPDGGKHQSVAFKNGTEYEVLKATVTRRLGLQDYNLSTLDVDMMYKTCTFESSWSDDASPWCAAFSEEDLQVLEYSSELKYYWTDGYGYELNYKQACPLVQDMLEHFKNASRATPQPKGVFYFTHSGTMLKVLAHLGLYRDKEPLWHHNFDHHKSSRLWRVGRIDSFAANLAAVLYSCDSTPKVMFLHQERPVAINGCPSEEPFLCPLETLEKLFPYCNFEQICRLPERTGQQSR
ncbi:Hypothetical predicted protein [Cloeon dipterum]|uniref:Multiple inositol polyphosphate phosphatase 1 n=1 Tax=Cloeon dipterum TaxID=197152 RepID=A0A8S1C1H8_9INSE|nr:Hypothetical predicted protein [Cloeon dipterum]